MMFAPDMDACYDDWRKGAQQAKTARQEASFSDPKDFNDIINAPAHYKSRIGGLESINVIEAFEMNFRLGNTIKYILRAGKKGNRVEDLKKARWYLDREIARSENPE